MAPLSFSEVAALPAHVGLEYLAALRFHNEYIQTLTDEGGGEGNAPDAGDMTSMPSHWQHHLQAMQRGQQGR